MKRHLVIVRCGRASLHPAWLENGAGRNWDLWLCPYQEGPADWPPARPGQKWDGLHALLRQEAAWRGYGYVWLPDDDLLIAAPELSRFFDRCEALGAALAAPALTEDSYYSHPITLRNRAFDARATSFVEIMAPCFRSDVLARLLQTLPASSTSNGWGLDYVWPRLLRYRDVYIVDEVTMRHTRPVGQLRTPAEEQRVRLAMGDLMARHGATAWRRTLRGYRDGAVLSAEAPDFLDTYLGGYDYLAAADAGALATLRRQQMEEGPGWTWRHLLVRSQRRLAKGRDSER